MSFSFIWHDFDKIIVEVLTAVSPVLVLFFIFVMVYKLPKSMLLNLFRGIILAFVGLALFLQGVKVGFMPVGTEMGSILGSMPNRWILIPLGFVLGFVATLAEPAVRILSNQVESNSSGYIKSNLIIYTLCIAVGIFIALGMTRIVYGIPFYHIIIPGYLLAMILMFFSKPSFTAIAFDSGGVATGPMTVTFIMALAVGAADTIEGRDAVIDGFGLIALVALAPIIMVMLLGFIYPAEKQDADDDEHLDQSEADNIIKSEPESGTAEDSDSSLDYLADKDTATSVNNDLKTTEEEKETGSEYPPAENKTQGGLLNNRGNLKEDYKKDINNEEGEDNGPGTQT